MEKSMIITREMRIAEYQKEKATREQNLVEEII